MGADLPLGGRTILLDPGHGGADNYQVGRTGLVEADYVDRVADHLQTMLERAGARVVRTRRGNATVSVEERIALARRAEPELTISLHLGRFRARSGVAACFNWRHGLSGWRLARRLARRLSAATGLSVAGVRWRRGAAGAGYELIYACRTPAAVLELGQLGSQPDEVVLAVPDAPQRLAAAVFQGVLEQLGGAGQSWGSYERFLDVPSIGETPLTVATPAAAETPPAGEVPPTGDAPPIGPERAPALAEEGAAEGGVAGQNNRPGSRPEPAPDSAAAEDGGGGAQPAAPAAPAAVGLPAGERVEPPGSGSQPVQTLALPRVSPLRTVGISPLASALQSGLMAMPPTAPPEGVGRGGDIRPLATSGAAGGSLSAEEVAQMFRSLKQIALKPPASGQTLSPIQQTVPQPSVASGSQQPPIYQPGRPAQQLPVAQPPRRKT